MIRTAVTVVVIVLAAVIGFVAGKTNPNSSSPPPISTLNNTKTTDSLEAMSNPLFKSQTALFEGKINSVTGNNIQVESQSGQKGEFSLSDKLAIYKFPNNSSVASASSDVKTIETGKQVLMTLELINNKYQAVSISYFRQAQ